MLCTWASFNSSNISEGYRLPSNFWKSHWCIEYNIWSSSFKWQESLYGKKNQCWHLWEDLLGLFDKNVSLKKGIWSFLCRADWNLAVSHLPAFVLHFSTDLRLPVWISISSGTIFFRLIRAWKGLDLWRAACNDARRRWSRITAVCRDHLSSEWRH